MLFQNNSGDMPLLNLPCVCMEQPATGKAFCKEHCEMLEKENPNLPTKLREFLEFIGMLTFIKFINHTLHHCCVDVPEAEFCCC